MIIFRLVMAGDRMHLRVYQNKVLKELLIEDCRVLSINMDWDVIASEVKHYADVIFEMRNGEPHYYKNRTGKPLPKEDLVMLCLQAQRV